MLTDEIVKEITLKDNLQAFETIAEAFGQVMDKIYIEGLIPYGDDITNNLDAAHSFLRKAIAKIKDF